MSLTRRDFLTVSTALSATVCAPGIGAQANGADTILMNGQVHIGDGKRASAVAITGDRFTAIGNDASVLKRRGPKTRVIDLEGRTVIPGLNDSHMHFIRTATAYNQQLRWDGVPSLALALQLIREQAARTPAGQWIRVDGGWSPYQFAEKRMPTVEELNAAAPNTPVYILLFYETAILNRAAMKACGYGQSIPAIPGGEIQRDARGKATGVLFAKPFPALILSPLGRAPLLSAPEQRNSVLQFVRELHRLGLTSIIDPGSVGVAYPKDYEVITRMHAAGELGIRLTMYLLPQQPGKELADFEAWFSTVPVGRDDDWFRFVSGGEILLNEAMDWDVYTQPPVNIPARMEADMRPVMEQLIRHRWSFRHHATYDATITRLLNVLGSVQSQTPLNGLRWTIDHAEFISERNIQRIKALGGGVAVQHRFAFHGELAAKNLGAAELRNAPPLRQLIESGIPLGAGTDSTRDSTYNPWVALKWLVTGKTVGGLALASPENRLHRATALGLYTHGSAWFSGDEKRKGKIIEGQLADLAVLSADYFSIPENDIDSIESVLTLVGGQVMHAAGPFAELAPPPPPVLPAWSPVAGLHPGYYRSSSLTGDR